MQLAPSPSSPPVTQSPPGSNHSVASGRLFGKSHCAHEEEPSAIKRRNSARPDGCGMVAATACARTWACEGNDPVTRHVFVRLGPGPFTKRLPAPCIVLDKEPLMLHNQLDVAPAA